MEKREEQFIISLLDKDAELRQYYEEHQELENKLVGYEHKVHLTPLEEMERKKLQKLKLIGKDKIMQILARHRQTGTQRKTE